MKDTKKRLNLILSHLKWVASLRKQLITPLFYFVYFVVK